MRRVMAAAAGGMLAGLLLLAGEATAGVLFEEHFDGLKGQLAGPARAPANGEVAPQAVADESPAQLPGRVMAPGKNRPQGVSDGVTAVGQEPGDAPLGGATYLPGAPVKTPHGIGWTTGLAGEAAEETSASGAYLRYPAARAVRAARGAIEIDLVRQGHGFETLFALVDRNGLELIWFAVDWKQNALYQSGQIPGTWYAIRKGKVFPPTDFVSTWKDRFIPLEPTVREGQECHFVVSWGPEEKDNALYLNGRKLDARIDRPFLMPTYVAKAEYLILGALTGGNWVDSEAHLTSSLEYVRTFDTPEDGARLLRDPLRYYDKTHGTPLVKSIDQNFRRLSGFSGKLVAGDKLRVGLQGTPGVQGTFDIARLSSDYGEIALDWRGYGVYLEDKVFFERGEVNLRDVDEYRVYAAEQPFGEITEAMIPAGTLKPKEQSYVLTHLKPKQPYYVAVVAAMRDQSLQRIIWPRTGLPMEEVTTGVYEGVFTVGYEDRFPAAVAIGHLSRGQLTATLADTETLVIDPSLTVAVVTEPKELKADEQSTAKVTVTVTDGNGNAVSGHKIRFLLATTSQYTGVVGGGNFKDAVGGVLKEEFLGETDLFGKVSASYVAGFAAKTAVIVARDMASNDVGAGYVTSYIQAAAELELEPAKPLAAAAEGYEIQVTSSDRWLTADGRSQARITALVTLHGKAVEGHRVSFSVSSGTGSIRTVRDTTDRSGEARAVYTAGHQIGMVLVTATDQTVGISGGVQIELRSDAPAKIKLRIKPEKLPADGHSVAKLEVQVTDINDNPNDGAVIEYRLVAGSGRLRDLTGTTDRNGEHVAEFVAGRTPGTVRIELTVRSYVPTQEDLAKARDLALAVPDYNFF